MYHTVAVSFALELFVLVWFLRHGFSVWSRLSGKKMGWHNQHSIDEKDRALVSISSYWISDAAYKRRSSLLDLAHIFHKSL